MLKFITIFAMIVCAFSVFGQIICVCLVGGDTIRKLDKMNSICFFSATISLLIWVIFSGITSNWYRDKEEITYPKEKYELEYKIIQQNEKIDTVYVLKEK
jgi:cytosine/uracil/thiamine/allantoin permease